MSVHQTDSSGRRFAAILGQQAPGPDVPRLRGRRVTLRELWPTDAASLSTLLTTGPVTRFIMPPPRDLKGFRDFIAWTQAEQRAGRQCSFAIVPEGEDRATGLIQVRRTAPAGSVAEWGFILGQRYWGTGLFAEAATIVLEFLFAKGGIHRLEARTAVSNPRGNGVLQKLGFHREWRYQGAFEKEGERFDEALWSMTAAGWRRFRSEPATPSRSIARSAHLHGNPRAAH